MRDSCGGMILPSVIGTLNKTPDRGSGDTAIQGRLLSGPRRRARGGIPRRTRIQVGISARRIDVTLQGKMLDNYAVVRGYLEHLNQLGAERGFRNLFCLSDTEVINMALNRAASSIAEEAKLERRGAAGNCGAGLGEKS
jgi:hypothetical protein